MPSAILNAAGRIGSLFFAAVLGGAVAGAARPLFPEPTAAAPVPEEVRAQRFVLVDARGNIRAALTPAPDGSGSVGLAFFATSGNGEPRLLLNLSETGAAALAMSDTADTTRLILTNTEEGPALGMFDASGNLLGGMASGRSF